VEQQGGRFLEQEKGTGEWYVVPYKRAVDKTSQGLRERERDPDDDDDGRALDPADVPESFQGKSNSGPTNLSDLAAVAVAHANGTRAQSFQVQPGYADMQLPQGYVRPGGALLQQQGAGMQRSGNKRPFVDASLYSNKRGRLDSQGTSMMPAYPPPPSLEARQSSIFRFMKQTQQQYLPGANGSAPSESSSHSATSAALSPAAYPTKLNNLSVNSAQKSKLTADTLGMYSGPAPPGPTQFQISDSLFSPTTFFEPQPSQMMSAPPLLQQGDSLPAQPGDGIDAPMAAPPLSRLTTQISDWLTSFWPLQGKAEAERTGRAGYPSDPLDGDPFETEGPNVAQQMPLRPGYPNGLQQSNLNVAQQIPGNPGYPSNPQNNAPARESLPFPNSRLPPEIQHKIKIPKPFNLEENKPVITTVPPPSKSSPARLKLPHEAHPNDSKPGKRKNRTNLPPLPYDTDAKAASGWSVKPSAVKPGAARRQPSAQPLLKRSAAPAEPVAQLEPNVSTTFLKLAASPSRLLAGLTSFFDRPSTTTAGTAADVGVPDFGANQLGAGRTGASTSMPAQGISMPRRGSKSTKSLLDDDEDTPMEARLRAIPGHLQKPF
jgi:hypothetical protein